MVTDFLVVEQNNLCILNKHWQCDLVENGTCEPCNGRRFTINLRTVQPIHLGKKFGPSFERQVNCFIKELHEFCMANLAILKVFHLKVAWPCQRFVTSSYRLSDFSTRWKGFRRSLSARRTLVNQIVPGCISIASCQGSTQLFPKIAH